MSQIGLAVPSIIQEELPSAHPPIRFIWETSRVIGSSAKVTGSSFLPLPMFCFTSVFVTAQTATALCSQHSVQSEETPAIYAQNTCKTSQRIIGSVS